MSQTVTEKPSSGETKPSVQTEPVPKSSSAPIEPLRLAWFAGHVLTCVGIALEVFAYAIFQGHSKWSQYVYRTTFTVVVATYGISLRKKLLGQLPSFFALLPLESFQYGALAALWLISRRHLLKLIPYFVYSLLQSATFVSTKLLPAGSALSTTIDSRITSHGHQLARFVAWANVLLFLRLVLDVFLIRSGAFVSLLFYGFFYRIQMEYTPETKIVLKELEGHVDTILSNPKVPAKVRELWSKAKWTIDNYETHNIKPKKAAPEETKAASTAIPAAKERKGSASGLFLNDPKK